MWRTVARQRSKATILALGCFATSVFGVEACMDSAIALRFREAYVPGFVEGASAAVTDPDNAEDGIRTAFAAFFEGLGAVIEPRNSFGSGSTSNRR